MSNVRYQHLFKNTKSTTLHLKKIITDKIRYVIVTYIKWSEPQKLDTTLSYFPLKCVQLKGCSPKAKLLLFGHFSFFMGGFFIHAVVQSRIIAYLNKF